MAGKRKHPAASQSVLPPEAIPKAPTGPLVPEPQPFPVVGIGASAGGLAAFEAFFSGMPADADPGMAFVVVQHLAPDHKSMLTELIRRCTRMQVFEVTDGIVVQPNCTYIIPPGHDMAFFNGALHLLEPTAPRGQRMPIDYFFRSLAQDQHENAIGIVLSGTGSDGTQGLRAIKGEAGVAMAQSPETAEYDGMPRSAIATGVVDYELAPAQMPQRLIAYAARAFGRHPRVPVDASTKSGDVLKKIFILLRSHTGHDFSQYKPSTIQRRIERRMAVHQIDTIDGYVKYLQQTPPEIEALFHDMLIGVTQFFRDAFAFEALETKAVAELFTHRAVGETLRVWVVGCSTGEEAYSIAILLQERMEALRQSWIVQVFATDIDSRAIAVARSGVYPASVVTDISAQRLARFFALMPDGTSYRVHKSIRDMLVFSEHDLNKDPPFSRVDLISCRNLLIYLGPELQKKIIPTFHYALNAQGMLFLGTSEGVGDFLDLFSVLERKAKLYLRRDAHPVPPQLPRSGPPRPTVAAPAERTPSQRRRPKSVASGKLSLHELTEQALLRHMASTAVLVDARGDILYLHGRTGMYLELPPGEALANNIIKLSREGLRHALTVALHKAVAQSAPVHVAGLQVRTNGDFTTVNLSVSAVEHDGDASASLYLVVLDEVATAAAGALPAPSEMPALVGTQPADATIVAAQARIAALQEEMRAKDEYLQTTQEELESANEELKSSNEEMQSVNEELQSTNEELETSKEELQSVNEELSTVNAELQTKVLDLQRANNDMNNLLAGTGIATVFVDHALRILRFTPNASLLINLIQADVGRPVSHIVSNLIGYDRLVADAQSVLDNLIPVEVEVQTRAGRWYTMRIQPYRTLENVIEGAVITFVDVSDTVQTRQALRAANERIQSAGPRG